MPRHLSIQDYTYPLPDDRIALHPSARRDDARLLVYRDGRIADDVFRHAENHLPAETMLVVNNTRVVEARLLFTTRAGAPVELFYLEPADALDQARAMARTGTLTINCFIGKARKWKPDEILVHERGNSPFRLQARLMDKSGDHYIVRLDWTPEDIPFAEVLHEAGQIPLPPYIRRKAEAADAERYQTVYAQHHGSVAAPTAGLHFTEAVLSGIARKGIRTAEVTLHVGAGTFKPVQAATMAGHAMHGEFIDVSVSLLRELAAHLPQPVVAVGTTSLRTLESLYWLGVQALRATPAVRDDVWEVGQFEPYDQPSDIPTGQALHALADALEKAGRTRLLARTHLLIAPGYRFRLAEGLFTNFHQPQSTLLLLVAAFIGPDWRRVYEHALAHEYRFLSYGDSSLLWKAK